MRFIVGAMLLAVAAGHARIRIPTGWNTQPSTASPCGGGAKPAQAQAVYAKGVDWNLQWQVVAGDGAGAVGLHIDPAGGTTFPTDPIFTTDPFTAVGVYNFTVPASVTSTFPSCTGSSGCTIRFKVTTNSWQSCSSVQIGASPTAAPGSPTAPTPGPTVGGSCVMATGLSTCTLMNSKNVWLLPGQDIKAIDALVRTTRDASLANPNVFNTSNATGCFDAYTRLLCSIQLPSCATPPKRFQSCNTLCRNAVSFCTLNVKHALLYQCTDDQFSITDVDSTGSCPAVGVTGNQWENAAKAAEALLVSGGVAAQPAFLVALLAVVAALLR